MIIPIKRQRLSPWIYKDTLLTCFQETNLKYYDVEKLKVNRHAIQKLTERWYSQVDFRKEGTQEIKRLSES